MEKISYQGPAAIGILIFLAGIMIGIGIEHWRQSPLRRIHRKYRAERRSALRN